MEPAPDSDAPQPDRPEPVRKIIHVDMDAFYASVEQRDNPDLRGRPVAVGGRERGVVTAASYEARKFGVRSAMPSVTAMRACPELIFVKPRFEVYREVSRQIRDIFESYTPLVEPLSLDEAYLDVTENLKAMASATQIARDIRAAIFATTGLTASAGVSYNKFLAKVASDFNKPDGMTVIPPSKGEAFVAALPIGKFYGVGPVTAAKMQRLGIETGADLRNQTLAFLDKQFGKSGGYYYRIARGVDHRRVNPDRERKSLGAERTFFTDLSARADIEASIAEITEEVWRRCDKAMTTGRTVTLKVKYADFQQITRSRSGPAPICAKDELDRACALLIDGIFPLPKAVRLLGVTLSNMGEPALPPGMAEPAQFVLQL
jgi:DNA polymerase-4